MIEVIDTLSPKNNGEFPVVQGKDVDVNGERLPSALDKKADKTTLQSLTGVVDTKANKSEVTALAQSVEAKADKSSTYTKQEVDTKIANVKVDAYTKAETDDKLNAKADKQVVSQLEGKMNSLGLTVENGMLCVTYGG